MSVFTNLNKTDVQWLLIFLIVSLVVFLSIFIPIVVLNNIYKNFVLEHSRAIKELEKINKKYSFKNVANLDMEHSYDNDHSYDSISLRDYLTYQLVYKRKQFDTAIANAHYNAERFKLYSQEIAAKCEWNDFDTDELLRSERKLVRTEKRLFEKRIKEPVIEFSVRVKLKQTKINGDYVTNRYNDFDEDDIREIEHKLDQKRGAYYLDSEVWDAICRVERGKVSNKMRFSIYERDGYRCCMCGRRGRDNLEVDHIIPIAKGGKSTYDNLQTLCHRCNVKKGDKIL